MNALHKFTFDILTSDQPRYDQAKSPKQECENKRK